MKKYLIVLLVSVAACSENKKEDASEVCTPGVKPSQYPR